MMSSSGTNGAPPPPQKRRKRGRGRGQQQRGGSGRGSSNGEEAVPESGPRMAAAAAPPPPPPPPGQGEESVGMEVDSAVQPASALQVTSLEGAGLHAGARTSKTTRAYLTSTAFGSLGGVVSESTLRGISEKMGYATMTVVQERTLPTCLSGQDVVGKAKTGTGKTLAFMIPCVERAIKAGGQRLTALVVSPTRELAQQTLEEGRLAASFQSGLRLACVVGGTPIKKDYSPLKSCGILVATPGRLNDHIENTAGFAARLDDIELLVFDECDQLLEGGFKPAIDALLRAMVKTAATRQTLLFSATLPRDVARVAEDAMRPGYAVIDCVGEEEDPTHSDIPQSVLVAKDDADLAAELAASLSSAVAQKPNHKIIVFFQTARMTQLYFELLRAVQARAASSGAAAAPIVTQLCATTFLEMHSRKSQPHRDRVAKRFREESRSGLVMLTSDVSARGMDYPDIDTVIQLGAPSDPAQYVHRLGRTGRGDGVRGAGLLILADFETFFLKTLTDLPVQHVNNSDAATKGTLLDALELAAQDLPAETRGQAYQAWMGYYNSSLRKLGWSKEHLVAKANAWVRVVCQASDTPALQAKTVGKMGLKGTPGLVIDRGGGSGSSGRGDFRAGRSGSGSGTSSAGQGRGRGRGRRGRG